MFVPRSVFVLVLTKLGTIRLSSRLQNHFCFSSF